MNDNSILKLLEGMNTQQAKEFTRRIIPALEVVRAEVLETSATKATRRAHDTTSTASKSLANEKANDTL